MASRKVILSDGSAVELGEEELARSVILRDTEEEAMTVDFDVDDFTAWQAYPSTKEVDIDRAVAIVKVADALEDGETLKSVAARIADKLLPADPGAAAGGRDPEKASSVLSALPDRITKRILRATRSHPAERVVELLCFLPFAVHTHAAVLRAYAAADDPAALHAVASEQQHLDALAVSLPLVPSIMALSLRLANPGLLATLPALPTLRTLDISGTVAWGPPDTQARLPWIEHISSLTCLSSLDASGNALQPRNSSALVRALGALTNLTALNLNGELVPKGACHHGTRAFTCLCALPAQKSAEYIVHSSYRTLRPVAGRAAAAALVALLPNLPDLEFLGVKYINWNLDLPGELVPALAPLPALSRLDLTKGYLNHATRETAVSGAGLQSLYLHLDLPHTPAKLSAFPEHLSTLTALTQLHVLISQYPWEDGLGLPYRDLAGGALASLTNLCHLQVDHYKGRNSQSSDSHHIVAGMAAAIAPLTALRSVVFQHAFLQVEHAAALGEALAGFPALTRLALCGCAVAKDHMVALAPHLPALAPSLLHLDLSCNYLVEGAAMALVEPLATLTALRHLDIADDTYYDGSFNPAPTILPALPSLCALSFLDLSSNMNSEQAEEVALSVAHLPHLRYLGMRSSTFEVEAASALVQALHSLTALECLDLQECDLRSGSLAELLGAMATAGRELHINAVAARLDDAEFDELDDALVLRLTRQCACRHDDEHADRDCDDDEGYCSSH